MLQALKDLKVWAKIILAPAVMVAGILILTIAAVTALVQQRDSIADFNNQRVANLEASSRLAFEIADINGGVYKILAWTTANYEKAKIDALLRQETSRLASTMEALDKLAKKDGISPDEAKHFAEALEKYKLYADAAKGVLDMADDPTYAAMYMAKADSTFESLSKTLDDLIRYEQGQSQSQYEQALQRVRSDIVAFIVLVAVILTVAVGITFVVNRLFTRSISEIAVAAQALCSGDLRRRVAVLGRDEIGMAAQSFNDLISNFQTIVNQVHRGAEQVNSGAVRLAQNAVAIVDGSEAQTQSASASAAGVEQMTASIAAVADTAVQLQEVAARSLEDTSHGRTAVDTLAKELDSLGDAVNRIADSVASFVDKTDAIIGLTSHVRDIAEQTNLLALNAAIEAARAGESGRGFAVVADEVRKLAENSSQMANEINSVTRQLTDQTGAVRQAVDEGKTWLLSAADHMGLVSSTLDAAANSVTEAAAGVKDITSCVQEQHAGSTVISQNIEQIVLMTEKNDAAVREASKEAESLRRMAAELKAAIDHFSA